MKTINTFLLTIITSTCMAQIPNASFENWETKTIMGKQITEPTGWYTTNWGSILSNAPVNVTKTSEAHEGNFAMKLSNLANEDRIVANASSISMKGIEFIDKFPINGKPTSLKGFFKYKYSSKDTCIITVMLYKDGNNIGFGQFSTDSLTTNYTAFNADIAYYLTDSTDKPDSASIFIWAASIFSDETPWNPSVELWIDALSFYPALTTSVAKIKKDEPSFTMYPNPATNLLHIQLKESASPTVIEIYDITGKALMNITTSEKQAKQSIDISELKRGIYFVYVQSGNERTSQKLIVN
jgi:hypothetical protein